MELLDDWWFFSDMREEDGFEISADPTREMIYQDKVGKAFFNSVTYEMSLTRRLYYRQVYNLLDFLAELGGLLSIISRTCFLIIFSLQFFGSYQFVMMDTFWDRSAMGGRLPWLWKTENRYDKTNNLQWKSCKSILITAHTYLPRVCLRGCLKPSKKEK